MTAKDKILDLQIFLARLLISVWSGYFFPLHLCSARERNSQQIKRKQSNTLTKKPRMYN